MPKPPACGETTKLANNSDEAYTENHIGHRENRIPEVLASPREHTNLIDETGNAVEVYTK
mgnify:CR=1 FL=1